MQIFVAGAAGAIGRQLVPMLVAAGHAVTGTTRSGERARWLESVGATPAVLDAYDPGAVHEAMLEARPEVVIHQLTDLARGFDREQVAKTGRLREVGTRNLVEAALAVAAYRLVAQSGAWLYADGPLPHEETHPLRTPTSDAADAALRGVLELERLVTTTSGIDGVVLRYGFFYGRHTAWRPDNAPSPHVAVEAAARAAMLAIDHGPPGVYNVVDDDDAISNQRARQLLGWAP
ncbi:MAG: NAD-dependent epimerase/dehydratase family protein [Chloroflexota bacterium]|nr:NAD-dependent epimerase/dehydratase family protein [Chloroflexota bacterium]